MYHASMSLLLVLGVIAIVSYLWLQRALTRPSSRSEPALQILYDGPPDGPAEIDIVAVHGLGANFNWSWVFKGDSRHVHWLRDHDMLPARVPQARIIAYNYDSKWHADAPRIRLPLCGEDLVTNLTSFRTRTHSPERPLILIGHSLGGNVIQHGLIHAEKEGEYKGLVKATAGLVFLGTPFRGTKMKPLAEFVASLMKLMGSHNGIVKDLAYDDPVLNDKLTEFCSLCRRQSLVSRCFFETHARDYRKKFGFIGFAKGMCVEESSASIPGHRKYRLGTDHFMLNKFAGPDDWGYERVSYEIERMVTESTKTTKIQKNDAGSEGPDFHHCLRDVSLTDPADYKEELRRTKRRADKTCEWILETEKLKAWMCHPVDSTDHSNVLWLHGNPGTGKSTMALYLVDTLAGTLAAEEDTTLAYFFCGSRVEQKTATSVVRGLLYQIVQQHPQLLKDYVLAEWKYRPELFTSFEAVWRIFINAVRDEATERSSVLSTLSMNATQSPRG